MVKPRQSSRPSRADLRRRSESRSGTTKFVVALVVMGLVAAAYVMVARSNIALDEVTLCPERPESLTVLLVDVTDPMNLPQQQDFQNQLVKLKNSIPRYGQLTVVRVDATSKDLLKPIITRCNPGTSADTDQFRGNPAKLQKQWKEGFDEPLSTSFRNIVQASGAPQSPILESIQSVALTELQRPGTEDVPKRLILASDLLQNTQALSFYGKIPDQDELLRSASFSRVRTDLRGVDVELWQLQRDDAGTTQPRALSELWERIIDRQGGTVSRIYNVSG